MAVAVSAGCGAEPARDVSASSSKVMPKRPANRAAPRPPQPRRLTQAGGRAGCVSEAATARCARGVGLRGATGVTVSPDGRNVYVTSSRSSSVAVFDRDAATGALRQKRGRAGCISDAERSPCARGVALGRPTGVTVSPDGLDVYVTSFVSDAVAIFDRDPDTGALRQKPGRAACVALRRRAGDDAFGVPAGLCSTARAIEFPNAVVISPDGASAYVASFASDAVAIFDRDRDTGALKQKPGRAGCVSEGGIGGCARGRAMRGLYHVAMTAGGETVYGASADSNAVVVLARDRRGGALRQLSGTAGCVSRSGTKGACVRGRALGGAIAVGVTPDGRNAYVATLDGDGGVAVFDRSAAGRLRQKRGRAGCVVAPPGRDGCAVGRALGQQEALAIAPDGANVFATSSVHSAVAVFNRVRAGGQLRQRRGRAGCIAETERERLCTPGRGLRFAVGVAVSPDGRNVYVAAFERSAVAVLRRR